MFSFICVWINDWVNNREAGDLRRYRAHYDVIVMSYWNIWRFLLDQEQCVLQLVVVCFLWQIKTCTPAPPKVDIGFILSVPPSIRPSICTYLSTSRWGFHYRSGVFVPIYGHSLFNQPTNDIMVMIFSGCKFWIKWQQVALSTYVYTRQLHNPSLMAVGLSVEYEIWPPIGCCFPLYV